MKIFHKIGITISIILLFRLLFVDRGVIDYFRTNSILDEKLVELDTIKRENKKLSDEINKINSDLQYQKKLVRETLGVIEKNESLVLFRSETNFSNLFL